jgi:GrpB-like predicted nucleotidyltransferase (UPF0157 family)
MHPSVQRDIDEPIEVVPYDARWAAWYAVDAAELAYAVGRRVRAVEHFGSTAIAGLCAKPIIDVLVAFVEWPLALCDRVALESLAYEYLGEAGVPGREYFRRRAEHATNVAVVEWGGALWMDNLVLRDFLRAHPDTAREYAEEKQRAWSQGARTLLRYSSAKSRYVSELVSRAKQWQSRASSA